MDSMRASIPNATDNKTKRLLELLTTHNPALLDPAVYSIKQNFRLLGCHKLTDHVAAVYRTKTLSRTFAISDMTYTHTYSEKIEDADHQEIMDLEESLISVVMNCKSLPEKCVKVDTRAVKYAQSTESLDIGDKELDLIMDLLARRGADVEHSVTGEMIPTHGPYLSWQDPDFPYVIREVGDYYIALDRRYPSYCRLCKHRHESENPYLWVRGSTIYFDCRRRGTSIPSEQFDESKYWLVGEIPLLSMKVKPCLNKNTADSHLIAPKPLNIFSQLKGVAESRYQMHATPGHSTDSITSVWTRVY
jgi:hypothetical protein